ncbi:DUF2065 domain-containing protein [Roseomonas soli]|uniref:DUF2065 domain-containing protein n=1 Tax=Neoroseomonas soli TaxID=1081025 RepID=A0A9X9WWI1_9PROT|nr:DUF2065 domain-containing protein [Neoroseomonas soli]MBR0671510.1 DUF2065 domain-containing protein [Neoroseomonas soli]
MTSLLQGVAVVLALEGIVYAVAPEAMRRALVVLITAPESRLRAGGLVAAALGVGLAWLLDGR